MLNKLSKSLVVPARLMFLMWAVFLFEISWYIDLGYLGIIPRTIPGLLGVAFGPVLHGNFWHLASNTVPLLFLGTTLYYFYGRVAGQVFLSSYFLPGLLVWIFARQNIHIGASGLIYGLAFFLMFIGFFRKDFRSLFISAIVILLYGSLFYGLFPMHPGVSWESHLFGGIVGLLLAIRYGKKLPARHSA